MYSLLKGRSNDPARPIIDPDRSIDDRFDRIRCPLCFWQPTRASRWTCYVSGKGPEPPFHACGTIWNTFETRGRCPGCAHQWIWTHCPRCGVPSLHEDWYESSDETD